jgi:hypothetical protein
MKMKYLLILILLIGCGIKMSSCNINTDSLFNYHIASMDQHLKSIIDGYILPTGNTNNKIVADK